MDLGLRNRIALVAAASRGLGRAVAEELAAEGASLVLCSRDQQVLSQTASEIEKTSGRSVIAVAGDVTSASDVARVVSAGIEKFGRIDILVTNAGGPPAGKFENLSREQWESATQLTLFSATELARQVLPG